MIIRRESMTSEIRAAMRGGPGEVSITHLVNPEQLPHARLLAEVVLEPGSGIGPHRHEEETEYYIILSGAGVVDDDGEERTVSQGDVVVTGGGATHSIRCTSVEPLRLIALIITD